MRELPKSYIPRDHEESIYKLWESSSAFVGKIDPNKKPFVISMPPPNVTGRLHSGHALTATTQDIMIRFHRMRGEPTLWLPGTDHAGIATQNVIEKALKKEGKTKHGLGREQFVKRAWQWKEKYGGEIINQTRRLGASCDWTRERFTLDEGLSAAVNEAFERLYTKDLIYRGLRTINWCPRCQSAISDDEVEYKKESGKLYWLKYGPFALATARPETKLGDTAVAVHPTDKRYKKMVGKKYKIPGVLGEFEIVVVADRAVDPSFGGGAVKVTPAHSLVDFEIAQRHGVPLKQVIDKNGRMMEDTGKYAGMKTREAREAIVKDMLKMGLIEKIEESYEHNIAICYRCSTQIEPIPSKQWFVKMAPLAKAAKKAVEEGKIKIIPKRFEKVYFHWLANIRDWCISRQLWWGHRIPVWYRSSKSKVKSEKLKADKSNIYVGVKPPKDGEWVQDEDVLDTWFSSALWPFSTLGWPKLSESLKVKSENCQPLGCAWAPGMTKCDYAYFYPTSVMETGYDILFFWVARMIMMGLELTGKAPFKTVYLHGMVRDEQNRKMSKSLGNIIEPLEVADKFGTDAVRMALVVGTGAGADSKVGESKIKGYRNFANKIWNIARFVLANAEELNARSCSWKYSKQDEQELKRLDEVITKTTKHLDSFRFSQAGELLYGYTWHEFADKIIEDSKERLSGEDKADKAACQAKLVAILVAILKLLHPFAPFVTEAIWQKIPEGARDSRLLIVSPWPKPRGPSKKSAK